MPLSKAYRLEDVAPQGNPPQASGQKIMQTCSMNDTVFPPRIDMRENLGQIGHLKKGTDRSASTPVFPFCPGRAIVGIYLLSP